MLAKGHHVTFATTPILTARERIEYHDELVVVYLPDATPRARDEALISCGDCGG